MNVYDEIPLKTSEVCARLHVSDYRRKQLIANGILEPPIDLGGAYPQHTSSQIQRAKQRIAEKSSPRPRNRLGNRPTKPISKKLRAELRGYR